MALFNDHSKRPVSETTHVILVFLIFTLPEFNADFCNNFYDGPSDWFYENCFMVIYSHVYTKKFEYSSFGNNGPTSRFDCDKLAPNDGIVI